MGSHWLTRLRARIIRRQQRSRNRSAEVLEQRTLLSVNALFSNGTLIVQSDAADSIVLGSIAGVVTLDVNGAPDTSLAPIMASAVESILITGSDADNTIDITNVTAAAFSFTDGTGNPVSIDIDAKNGNDTLLGSLDLVATLRGGDGNDTITSTAPADIILAGDGDDTVTGGAGNDSIDAGDGADQVTGNTGDDTIIGGDGADILSGGDGLDSILGGDGSDVITGDAGIDTIDGGSGSDVINGNDGDDSLLGGIGDDMIFGDAGLDFINGGDGNDVLNGGVDDDQLFGSSGDDVLNGDEGDDLLHGGLGNDTIQGNDGADHIFGGGGHDDISGGDGDDSLFGNSGNDTIIAGAGSDLLVGGAGDDLLDSFIVTVSINDVVLIPEADSGTTTAQFTLTLSEPTAKIVTVEFSTVNQTASAGNDFVGINNQIVTFAPGETVQNVDVSIIGDTVIESEEFFRVTLSNPINASIFDGLGQGNIQDNDNPGPNSQIGLNFQGTDSTQLPFTPPDTMGAVGPNHIVELLNGRFAVYDKATGTELTSSTLDQFVTANGGVIPPLGFTFDPRVVFDPTSDRWFAAVIDANTPANNIYVLVSTSNDPTQPWQAVQFVGDTIGNNRFNDYETLAVDADGVYLATNNFGATTFDVSLYSIPKADLLAATPTIANLTRFENLNAGTFGDTLQPALDFGPSDGVAAVFSTGGSGTLFRTDISGAGGAMATIGAPISITVPPYSAAPPGDQPSGTPPLENVSPRIVGNVKEVGTSFWLTHAVLDSATGNSAARWYEIDESTNQVIQVGTISDPNLDFLDPTIAVNNAGDVVIGYTGTGLFQSPSSYASIGQTVNGVTTFNQPLLLQQGTGTYFAGARNRWGDYSATVVDPSDPKTFWTFQELTIGGNEFAVQITEIKIGDPPPPPVPGPPILVVDLGDTMRGGSGNDTLTAGAGDDLLVGDGNDDSVFGGRGADLIFGGAADDTLDGGGGDDTILGQGGADQLFGSAGNDELVWRGAGDSNDSFDGGDGQDLLNVRLDSAANSVTVGQELSTLTISEGGFSARVASDGTQPLIEEIQINGGMGDDILTLTDINNVGTVVIRLNGEDGADTISAAGAKIGNVILFLDGGLGADTITGSAGGDSIGGGDDDDVINGGDGPDTIRGGLGNDLLAGGEGNDIVFGEEDDDTLTGENGDDLLNGGSGDDDLDGDNGNDTLLGELGSDTLLGDRGDDSVVGGSGADTLQGAAGDDTLDGGANDDVLLGNSGDDVLRGGDGNDIIRGHNGDDTIDGGDGDDVIFGLDGDDGIVAGDGADYVNAGSGDDIVIGGDGADELRGGGGDDVLFGNDGDDTLSGNGGTDTLVGGLGADQFDEPSEQNELFMLSAAVLASLNANV